MKGGLRVLACACDAGGAANVAPVCARIAAPLLVGLVGSHATRPIFQRQGLKGVIDEQDLCDEKALGLLFERTRPNVLLCGTTRHSSADRQLVEFASNLGIPSVCILDEWYCYAMRFRDARGLMTHLPKAICCPDELALNEAIAEGLPRDNLIVTGSPALSALWTKREAFEAHPPAVPACIRGAPKPVVLFLSETQSADYGEDDRGGPLGPFLGYTEDTVAHDLMEILSSIDRPCTVIEKLHPAADPSRIGSVVTGHTVQWRRVASGPLAELIWHADIAVGMRSMALLESSLLGRPTISYQPGLRPPHGPSTAERLGLVRSARFPDELKAWLQSFGFQSPSIRSARARQAPPSFAATDAVDRVLKTMHDCVRARIE